jgi:hypothetical protein
MISTPYTAARGLDDAPGGPMPGDDPDDPRGPEDSPHYSKTELYRAPALGPVDARREMTPAGGQSASGPERPAVPEPRYIDTSRRERPQRDVDASKINQLMAGLGALGTIAAGEERTTLSAIGAGLADAGATRQEQQDKRYQEDLRGYEQWLADARKRNALLRQGYRQQQYEAERSDYEAERQAERTRRQNEREHSRDMKEAARKHSYNIEEQEHATDEAVEQARREREVAAEGLLTPDERNARRRERRLGRQEEGNEEQQALQEEITELDRDIRTWEGLAQGATGKKKTKIENALSQLRSRKSVLEQDLEQMGPSPGAAGSDSQPTFQEIKAARGLVQNGEITKEQFEQEYGVKY